ncbi:MAG TPA: Dabb family protein [Sedimentisphaerales bacterium]|nr:Dabb family protein [Sedimentisphaerales bacterium]
MSHRMVFFAAAALAMCGCGNEQVRRQAKPPALAHNVYFTLHDNSPAAREKLVADCCKYLRDHPGVTFFAAGTLVEEHAREVNVRGWDVGLHIVFASKQDHDRYQKAADHLKFIEQNQQNWKTVHVYDTDVE